MEDLDVLIQRIQNEGVEQAKVAADKILEDARAKADEIIAKAKSDAEVFSIKAKADAERFQESGKATIRQAARDVILNVEKDITALFVKVLTSEVKTSLESNEIISELVREAVKAYTQNGDELTLVAGEKLLGALRGKLADMKDIKVVTDEQTGAGFRIKIDNNRIEHDFTAESVAESLAALLRPQLAELLR